MKQVNIKIITVDLHQKFDPNHDMAISMNSDVVKKTR